MSDLDSFVDATPATGDEDNSIVQTGPGQYQVGLGLLYKELQTEHSALQASHRNLVLVCRTLEAELAKVKQTASDLETLNETLMRQNSALAAQVPVNSGNATAKPAATKRTAARK